MRKEIIPNKKKRKKKITKPIIIKKNKIEMVLSQLTSGKVQGFTIEMLALRN